MSPQFLTQGMTPKPRPESYWDFSTSPHGREFYHYPSQRAQNYWLYAVSIGQAKTPVRSGHGHSDEALFLFHYIRRGELWHTLRNQTHRAGHGTACLLDLRESVRYGNDGPAIAENWWVCFGGRDMPQLFTELGADHEPVFTGLNTAKVEALFRELIALSKNPPAAYDAKANGLLHLLVAELFASRDPWAFQEIDPLRPPGRQTQLSEPVRNGLRYIARWYHQALGLKRLYRASGLSMYHFARTFRQELGMSPMQYLNRYRIERAKQLLLDKDHAIGHVARLVGMPDLSKFERIFRKTAGVTPSQYRSQALAKRR